MMSVLWGDSNMSSREGVAGDPFLGLMPVEATFKKIVEGRIVKDNQ